MIKVLLMPLAIFSSNISREGIEYLEYKIKKKT